MTQTLKTALSPSKILGLPGKVAARFRPLAWLVFLSQVLIVGTGGAVRLTGSGLGCSTWPMCTEDSFVHNPAMGIHSYIEFGNRTLFFLLEIVAILAMIVVWKYRKQRKDLFYLSFVASLSVFVQAIVGGITVLSGLNPYVVGLHYLASVLLVMLSALLVLRTYRGPVKWQPKFNISFRQWVWINAFGGAGTVILGILTTGAGPHAGDGGAARNNLNIELLAHLHAVFAYLTLFATVFVLFLSYRYAAYEVRKWATRTIGVMVIQIIVGVWQMRNALPPVLVGIHMVLATLLAATIYLMVVETYSKVLKAKDLEQPQAID